MRSFVGSWKPELWAGAFKSICRVHAKDWNESSKNIEHSKGPNKTIKIMLCITKPIKSDILP